MTYTSSNGCRLGICNSTRNHGYVGKCFEVPDRLKGKQSRWGWASSSEMWALGPAVPPQGSEPTPFRPHGSPPSCSDGSHLPPHRTPGDLARSYFYLATAYWRSWSCCLEPSRMVCLLPPLILPHRTALQVT